MTRRHLPVGPLGAVQFRPGWLGRSLATHHTLRPEEDLVEEALSIGIDLDGCIDEAPEFFRLLSTVWSGKIYVITFRRDYDQAVDYVNRFGIKYDAIILTPATGSFVGV